MTDAWVFFEQINFADETIKMYHVDTRDFCCLAVSEQSEKEMDFAKLKKHPEKFYHTASEVQNLLSRLFTESGGKKEWRCLTLKHPKTTGWELKYIRIHRTQYGLVVCNKDHYAMTKEALASAVEKEYL